MKRQRWRGSSRWVLRAAFQAATFAASACAPVQSEWTQMRATTPQGQTRETELAIESRSLIDAIESMVDGPGLFLVLESICACMGVRPRGTKTSVFNEGARNLEGRQVFERTRAPDDSKGQTASSNPPRFAFRWVNVDAQDRSNATWHPLRLIESLWGRPFVYKPFAVHAFKGELWHQQSGAAPTGRLDERSYNASFRAPQSSSARVTFAFSRGGCLNNVAMANRLHDKMVGDDPSAG